MTSITSIAMGLIECRERAKVVGISNPEYSGSSATDILGMIVPIAIVVFIILAIAAVVLLLVTRNKGANQNHAVNSPMPVVPVAGGQGASPAFAANPPMPAAPTGQHNAFCVRCGAEIVPEARFCPKCGAPCV